MSGRGERPAGEVGAGDFIGADDFEAGAGDVDVGDSLGAGVYEVGAGDFVGAGGYEVGSDDLVEAGDFAGAGRYEVGSGDSVRAGVDEVGADVPVHLELPHLGAEVLGHVGNAAHDSQEGSVTPLRVQQESSSPEDDGAD